MKTDNELIAEFMGLSYNGTVYNTPKVFKDSLWRDPQYATSWDWLMPVVARIAEYRLAYPKETGWVCDCKIVVYRQMLYREVVQFIKFFNTQPKT